MLQTLRNAWKIVDLRKKIFFTLLIVLLYRIGNVIPVPFVNVDQMSMMFEANLQGTILDMINMMSGNASTVIFTAQAMHWPRRGIGILSSISLWLQINCSLSPGKSWIKGRLRRYSSQSFVMLAVLCMKIENQTKKINVKCKKFKKRVDILFDVC